MLSPQERTELQGLAARLEMRTFTMFDDPNVSIMREAAKGLRFLLSPAAECEELRAENEQLRRPMAKYEGDGPNELQPGWTPVDAGYLDELEADRHTLTTLESRYSALQVENERLKGWIDSEFGVVNVPAHYSALEKASRPALEILQLFASESDRDLDAPSIPEVIDALAAALDALATQGTEAPA